MSNRPNLPETSKKAYKQVSAEMLQGHYKKIVAALSVLGTCNYEKIADYVGLDKHAVGRRIGELERMQIIYKPGTQSLTKNNRQAFNYCLTGIGLPKTDNEKKELKAIQSIHEEAEKLIQATNNAQIDLFP